MFTLSFNLSLCAKLNISFQIRHHIYISNKITLAEIIKIRSPLSRDTIIIPALVVASVTLRYPLPSIIPVWLGNKHRSYSYVGKIYTARRIIYHLARRGKCVPFVAAAHTTAAPKVVHFYHHTLERERERERP